MTVRARRRESRRWTTSSRRARSCSVMSTRLARSRRTSEEAGRGSAGQALFAGRPADASLEVTSSPARACSPCSAKDSAKGVRPVAPARKKASGPLENLLPETPNRRSAALFAAIMRRWSKSMSRIASGASSTSSAEALLAGAQLVLGLPARGDVDEGDDDAVDLVPDRLVSPHSHQVPPPLRLRTSRSLRLEAVRAEPRGRRRLACRIRARG